MFVTGRQIRLDDLVIRSSADSPYSEALRVLTGQLAGANLRFEGGVSAYRNATLELFNPVIENAGEYGVGVFEDSYAFVSNCEILDASGAGVEVDASTFSSDICSVERSGENGLEARQSRVYLAVVSIVDSAESGIVAEQGSSIEVLGGIGQPSRIAGGGVGLELSGGSTAQLGESVIEQNQDGVMLGDASVLRRRVPYSPRVTGNTGAGVRCAPSPAVPQVALLGSTWVFGNGQDFVDCALP